MQQNLRFTNPMWKVLTINTLHELIYLETEIVWGSSKWIKMFCHFSPWEDWLVTPIISSFLFPICLLKTRLPLSEFSKTVTVLKNNKFIRYHILKNQTDWVRVCKKNNHF